MKTPFAAWLAATAVAMAAGSAGAETLTGSYRTEPGDTGRVLIVAFAACDAAPALTCATIAAAFDANRQAEPDYDHLGKPIVWDMKSTGAGKFEGGKIWDPSANKTYNSRMRARGGKLQVSGCIGPICKSQDWIRAD